MELIAFLLWLMDAQPYTCTTDYECMMECINRGYTDCVDIYERE